MRVPGLKAIAIATSGAATATFLMAAAPPTPAVGFHLPRDDGVFIRLSGDVMAYTYWIDGPDGFHVVTTLDSEQPKSPGAKSARHLVMRFSVVLRPGQTQKMAIPGTRGSAPVGIRIHRDGGTVAVIPASCDAQPAQPDRRLVDMLAHTDEPRRSGPGSPAAPFGGDQWRFAWPEVSAHAA